MQRNGHLDKDTDSNFVLQDVYFMKLIGYTN